ncbi:unnamed protein product [Dracunculus medinensis]|uniref:DUF3408 domain-containing protein n=1 Tax=Dracunculus medinensis TaxID=318479 RepID=A0A0N4U124_DRAME|nr:unnamed protein product [Dracunculus medinensis]
MAEKDFIERNYAASEQTVKPEIGNIQYESPAVNDENHPLEINEECALKTGTERFRQKLAEQPLQSFLSAKDSPEGVAMIYYQAMYTQTHWQVSAN